MKFRKLSYPYLVWMGIFILVPLFMILYYSLSINGVDGLTIANFKEFFRSINLVVLLHSIKIAFITTIICLLIGYPTAYLISKAPLKRRSIMLILIVLPMWMNFLLRTYAWMNILAKNGILNNFFRFLGLSPKTMLYTQGAIVVGMVYNFLPFMILPIYTVLEKMDNSLVEAAKDLGANNFQTFVKVIFPMSLTGVITGVTMVFIPAISTFEISALLGGNKVNLIGNVIENQFRVIGDWNYGSAISMVLMVIIFITMLVTNKFNPDDEKTGGGLW